MNLVKFENVKICFRNFSGAEGRFNPKGRRNFCVLLDSDTAEKMKADGWNIKYLNPREEGDEPQAYLQVSVKYRGKDGAVTRPPKVYLLTGKGKTLLNEDNVNILDWAELEYVDLIIRPYSWEVGGKTGVKAMLKTMMAKIVEDELESKYSNVPDSAVSSIKDGDDDGFNNNAEDLPF